MVCRRSRGLRKGKRRYTKSALFFHYCFPRYHDVQAYLQMLAACYPSNIRVECIGRSFHGRSIDMIVIAKDINIKQKSVLIDATIHAREWIAFTTALYIISYLVANEYLLEYMDFYIIPCLNPDGYEFCHTVNRLWRKNLNHNWSTNIKEWGVDLNRNFPFAYGKEGSKAQSKSNTYRGKKALSEPESKSLAGVMKKYASRFKLYISLHAHGNCIMYPWGFTKRQIADAHILHKCAKLARDVMYECNERRFKIGSVANTMYLTSGSTTDYAKGVHKIKFTYIIELQRGGKSGFTPSTRKILEIGKETMEGVKAMIKFVHEYYEVVEEEAIFKKNQQQQIDKCNNNNYRKS